LNGYFQAKNSETRKASSNKIFSPAPAETPPNERRETRKKGSSSNPNETKEIQLDCFLFIRMSEDGENRPPSEHFMMTTEAMSSYNHGAATKQEGDRTSSPVVLQSTPMHDYVVASPIATSHSSTSSQLSLDHHYNHNPHHHHLAPSSRTQPAGVTGHGISGPVRSASWAAGSPETANANVPAVITTKAGSTPNFAASTAKPQNPNDTAKPTKVAKSALVPAKKKQNAKNEKKTGDTVTARRQKRLERNRESARLSRRRRKQYLEVLEDRVKQLSIEMDSGRRKHTAIAIGTLSNKRREILNGDPNEQELALLDGPLSRSSNELSVLSTFNTQQLKSFSLPADSKCVLWLTLQGDTYFRGGRAASERLSAARIGERVSFIISYNTVCVSSLVPICLILCWIILDATQWKRSRITNQSHVATSLQRSWAVLRPGRTSPQLSKNYATGFEHVAGPSFSSIFQLGNAVFSRWVEDGGERCESKGVSDEAST
jgi:hypothetical protein